MLLVIWIALVALGLCRDPYQLYKTKSLFKYDVTIDCELRKLAYEYSKQLLPLRGEIIDVFDGLELNSLCNVTVPTPGKFNRPAPEIKGNEIYIDSANGNDNNPGTFTSPIKSLEWGIKLSRFNGLINTLILRGGYYYINETINLYPIDNGLSIVGYAKEEIVLSGGKKINPEWKEYTGKKGKIYDGYSLYVTGESLPSFLRNNNNDESVKLLGNKISKSEDCLKLCELGKCYGVSYYGLGNSQYSGQCYGVFTAFFEYRKESNVVTIINSNIYVADLSKFNLNREINTIIVNNRRAVRARYPNGNPETTGIHTKPTGYIDKAESWTEWDKPGPATEIHTTQPAIPGVLYKEFSMGLGGTSKVFDPQESYWALKNPVAGGGSTFTLPKSLKYDPSTFSANQWSDPSTGYIHAFHSGYWGNWMFQIDNRDSTANTISWSKGGFQEARGRPSGGSWYVDNIFEELDAPFEWFYDSKTQQLYYFPNETISEANEIIIPQIETIFNIRGTKEDPVKNVVIDGVTIAYTLSTFMKKYLVPSGGDWTIHPNGAMSIGGCENIKIKNNFFYTIGGNGLYVNDYVRETVIEQNEFKWLGDTAIVSYGTTQLNDGTKGTQPRGVKYLSNLIHEVGAFGKQTSAYFQARTAQVVLEGNVMFNGPRCGVNINDGFGGGNLITKNLMFNWVRETSDHGPINTWDRMPFITDVANPEVPSYRGLLNEIKNNFLFNQYGSTWPIDHDDGSCYWKDTFNALLYGGFKNYLGHSKEASNNFYVYPDAYMQMKGLGDYFSEPYCWNEYGVTQGESGFNETWKDNTCVIGRTEAYKIDYSGSDFSQVLPKCDNNTIYTIDGKLTMRVNGNTWDINTMHDHGLDVNTQVKNVSEMPIDSITKKIREILNMK